jgi:hypothetical protein
MRQTQQVTNRLLVGILCSIGLVASLLRGAVADEAWLVKVQIDLDASGHNTHTVWLRAPGSPISHMELRVTPSFNEGNEVTDWDVELLSFSDRTGNPERNLLAPKGNWHGLQPFMVLPRDIDGHGYYPARREIRQEGFHCVITVLGGETKPSRVTPNLVVFESLRLEVELDVDQPKRGPTPKSQK